jgi:ATPase components of ABC transporters with duplicated ATPase domains
MTVIDIQNIAVSTAGRKLLAIKNLRVQDKQRIGLVGKNGSGKTTLFNILIGSVEPDIGNFTVNGRIAMLPQLKKTDTTKSGGEISQEYIIRTLSKSPKILLADEPSTNLDTSHVEWIEKQLNEFPGAVILVSHDRTLLDNVCDTIWELTDGEITEYPGNYSAYIEQKENESKHQEKEYQKYQQKKKQLEQAIVL